MSSHHSVVLANRRCSSAALQTLTTVLYGFYHCLGWQSTGVVDRHGDEVLALVNRVAEAEIAVGLDAGASRKLDRV